MSFNINVEALEQQLESLGRFGTLAEGGLYRALYTPEWAQATEAVERLMREAGLSTHVDVVGNVFGRLPAKGGSGKGTILTGSHIDTVAGGGKYDGTLGILAGIAALRCLAEEFGPPKVDVEVVATCEEEGSRFNTSFWGARAILGMLKPGDADRFVDRNGQTIGSAMLEMGFCPDELSKAARSDIKAFLELHIEQGRVLESRGLQVGIVEAITGIKQFEVEVAGSADHAGTTPMTMRRDAARASAEMISAIASIAEGFGPPAVATVGSIRVEPGAKNVVPGRAVFSIDARHPDKETLGRMAAEIAQACRELAAQRGVEVSMREIISEPPVPMNDELVGLLESVASTEGIKFCRIVSGAGHDASLFGRVISAAMVFVPSVGGKSHSPEEYTRAEDLAPGVRVLTAALHRLAY